MAGRVYSRITGQRDDRVVTRESEDARIVSYIEFFRARGVGLPSSPISQCTQSAQVRDDSARSRGPVRQVAGLDRKRAIFERHRHRRRIELVDQIAAHSGIEVLVRGTQNCVPRGSPTPARSPALVAARKHP